MNYQINEMEARATIAKSMAELSHILIENETRIKNLVNEKTPLSVMKALDIIKATQGKIKNELALVKMIAISINDDKLIKQIDSAQDHFKGLFEF